MRQIETDILINSSSEKVWNKLMEFESYKSWNPFIQKISGIQKQNESLIVEIHLKNKKPQTFKPRVLVCTGAEFRWKGKLFFKGLFDGEHYFKLVKVSANETRFIHGEQFSGLLVPLIMKMIKLDTLKGFESMNNALKIEMES